MGRSELSPFWSGYVEVRGVIFHENPTNGRRGAAENRLCFPSKVTLRIHRSQLNLQLTWRMRG
jgi:hypothetical protein